MRAQEYVLGTQAAELTRLEFQHTAWVQQAYALWQRAGLRAGETVVDLGCGPGFTTFELAEIVGPHGRVIAHDRSAEFLQHLAAERDRRGLAQIATSEGPVEELSLPRASVDAVYARWLFCWLADPGAVLARVYACHRPGGALVLQEYLDWSAMRIIPRDARLDRLVEACMQSWRDAHSDMEVAQDVPGFAARSGLAVEHFQPIARAGRPGSLEWRWMQAFQESYAPKLVGQGLLTEAELKAGLEAVRPRGDEDHRLWITPTMADIVLRKPGSR